MKKIYKESNYNMFIDIVQGKHLAFNAMSGAIAEVDDNQLESINLILAKPMTQYLNKEENFLRQLLIQGNFLIPEERDEISLLKMKNRKRKYREDMISLIIFPTLDCNFRCKYCFEDRHPGSMMSEDVQHGIVSFVRNMLESGGKTLYVAWYGGEPLLEMQTIKYLSYEFKKLCKANNSTYTSWLTTNGYLLNLIAPILEDLNINGIQISLDGPPSTHNSYRPYMDGSETFETIFKNLVNLLNADKTCNIREVNLRINFNQQNMSVCSELLDMFPMQLREKISIYFENIFKNPANPKATAHSNICSGYKALRVSANLTKLAIERGYKLNRLPRYGRTHYCPSVLYNFYNISPNGDLHKCDLAMETYPPVGHIKESGECTINLSEVARWVAYEPFDDEPCISCKALPYCMGGCRLNQLQFKNIKCYRGNVDWLANEIKLIHMKYLYDSKNIKVNTST